MRNKKVVRRSKWSRMYSMIATPVLRIAGTFLLTYTTHYGASKVYTAVCVPDGLLGFVQGMFTTGSPFAQLSYPTFPIPSPPMLL